MSIVTDKETIFVDELIRENARLTVQHEADHQRILVLSDRVEMLEAEAATGQDAAERARTAENKLGKADAMLRQAIMDLHIVMAGGDPCRVCAKKCMMGEDNCQPVWIGEKTED